MTRMGSPKLHYINPEDTTHTMCGRKLAGNIGVPITRELTRVNCSHCLKAMAQ